MSFQLPSICKRRPVKFALEATLFVAVYFGLQTWMQRDLAQGPAPAIAGTTLAGQAVDLQALRGKPLLLHFWATWCTVCKLEQGTIESLSRDYTVVSVAMQSGSTDEVQAYMREHALTYPVINDPEGEIAARYGVAAVPSSFVVDAQGEIMARATGYTTSLGLRWRLWRAGA